MNSLKKIITTLMLSFMIFTAGGVICSTPVYAASTDSNTTIDSNAVDLSQSVNSIGGQTSSNMLGGTKDKVAGFSKEITDIVGIIVMAIVMCNGIFTAIKFKSAADNPSEKARLKTALVLETLCIIFLASYMAFVKFGFQNFNLFKGN